VLGRGQLVLVVVGVLPVVAVGNARAVVHV
jgi:hypothetical protein